MVFKAGSAYAIFVYLWRSAAACIQSNICRFVEMAKIIFTKNLITAIPLTLD